MFQPSISELYAQLEQHVLLDESLQGVFKKNISQQILELKREGATTTRLTNFLLRNTEPILAEPVAETAWNEVSCPEEPVVAGDWADATWESAAAWGEPENIPIISTEEKPCTYSLHCDYSLLEVSRLLQNGTRSHLNTTSKEVSIEFTKEFIPEKDGWTEVKVPGWYVG